MIPAALLSMILFANPPATPDRFTLTCTGERVEVTDVHRVRTPWRQVLRLDLKAKVWCEADCSTHHPIIAVKDDYIDLIDETEGGVATQSHLNRYTGGFTLLIKGKRGGHAVETGVLGYCERGTPNGPDR